MRILLLACLLIAPGCAELTRAPLPEPPVELAGQLSAAPIPFILNAAAADFDGAGQRLVGRPEATALALARLEWLGGEFRPGRRLAPLPESFGFAMQRAVQEGRISIGIAPDATPEVTVPALLAASRALRRGDQAAAQAALSGPAFLRGGNPVLVKLREPGAFPDAALAVPALRDEAARLALENRSATGIVFDDRGFGLGSTSGLGGSLGGF